LSYTFVVLHKNVKIPLATHSKKYNLIRALSKMEYDLDDVEVYRFLDHESWRKPSPAPIEVDIEYLLAHPDEPCKEKK
jgi:hypothetical protein